MRYLITTSDETVHVMDLPVSDDITWEKFLELEQVKSLSWPIIDITPEGMPDLFSEEERISRQLHNLGIKRTKNEKGVSEYEMEEPVEEE